MRASLGSIDWLYDGVFESGQDKQPATIKSLAENREKQEKKAKKDQRAPKAYNTPSGPSLQN